VEANSTFKVTMRSLAVLVQVCHAAFVNVRLGEWRCDSEPNSQNANLPAEVDQIGFEGMAE